MKHNNFTLSNNDENGMTAKIEFNNFRTKVSFGFNPDRVEYLGRVDEETFDKVRKITSEQ